MMSSSVRLALSAMAALSCANVTAGSPAAPRSAMLGQSVAFVLPGSDGTLAKVPLPGARATVLDFFGAPCAPCKERVPALVASRGEPARRGAGLVLVAVLGDGESSADA